MFCHRRIWRRVSRLDVHMHCLGQMRREDVVGAEADSPRLRLGNFFHAAGTAPYIPGMYFPSVPTRPSESVSDVIQRTGAVRMCGCVRTCMRCALRVACMDVSVNEKAHSNTFSRTTSRSRWRRGPGRVSISFCNVCNGERGIAIIGFSIQLGIVFRESPMADGPSGNNMGAWCAR
jgi:hypothetical protein